MSGTEISTAPLVTQAPGDDAIAIRGGDLVRARVPTAAALRTTLGVVPTVIVTESTYPAVPLADTLYIVMPDA